MCVQQPYQSHFCSGQEIRSSPSAVKVCWSIPGMTTRLVWKQQQPTAPACRASLSPRASLPRPAQRHFGPHLNTHTLVAEFNLVHSSVFWGFWTTSALAVTTTDALKDLPRVCSSFSAQATTCTHIHTHTIQNHVCVTAAFTVSPTWSTLQPFTL